MNNDLHIIIHCDLCEPMSMRVDYMPVVCKLEVKVTFYNFTIIHVDDLHRQKSPVRDPQNTRVVSHLSFTPTTSTHLTPCLFIVHVEEGTILIPVWSQFRMSSGGFCYMTTLVTTWSRKSLLNRVKFCHVLQLLADIDWLSLDKMHITKQRISPLSDQI